MKLSQLSEDLQADIIAKQQAIKNLAYTALSKARKILEPMGLLKGDKFRGNQSREPIPEAVAAFSDLRQAIQKKLLHDSISIKSNRDVQNIEQFWGVAMPTGYYDTESISNPVRNGQFDKLLARIVELSYDEATGSLEPLEDRIVLLSQLASAIRPRAIR